MKTNNLITKENISKEISLVENAIPKNAFNERTALVEEAVYYAAKIEKKVLKREMSISEKSSFVESLKAGALMNLRMGKHIDLIPFKGTFAMTFKEEGITHYINTFTTHPIKEIITEVVFKNDKFSYDSKTKEITHQFDPFENGRNKWVNIKGAYAIIEYEDGVKKVEFLSKEELEDRKNAGASQNSVYNKWPRLMGRAKVSKMLLKAAKFRLNLNKNITPDRVDDMIVEKVIVDKKTGVANIDAKYEKREETSKQEKVIEVKAKVIPKISISQQVELINLINSKGKDSKVILKLCKVTSVDEISVPTFEAIKKRLNAEPDIVVKKETNEETGEIITVKEEADKDDMDWNEIEF